jgi:hypothetical protein
MRGPSRYSIPCYHRQACNEWFVQSASPSREATGRISAKLFTGPIVLTRTPRGVREISTAVPQIFLGNGTPFLTPLTSERSLLLSDGSAHKPDRAMLMPRSMLNLNPQCFRPERFLGRSYTPLEYLPLRGGAAPRALLKINCARRIQKAIWTCISPSLRSSQRRASRWPTSPQRRRDWRGG